MVKEKPEETWVYIQSLWDDLDRLRETLKILEEEKTHESEQLRAQRDTLDTCFREVVEALSRRRRK